MKPFFHLLGIVCGICLMIILLFTSVEAVTYWTPGFYEKEYQKYNVTKSVSMEMDDLLDVTHEMMAYLRGNRKDLNIPTTVDGESREFFNDREKAHMKDVKGLFLDAIKLRRICIIVFLFCVSLLVVLKSRISIVLPKMICVGSSLFLLIAAGLAAIISTNFTKYFIIFHKIFFNNDLWMLDPSTDLLINIVPEGFFMDTAARIGATYMLSILFTFIVCFIILQIGKRIHKKKI